METINDIQIEVTEIRVKVHSVMNKRNVFYFKRRVFIGDIKGVSEENYLVENNYSKCTAIYVEDEGWVKVKEPYEEIKDIHSEWWRKKTEVVD